MTDHLIYDGDNPGRALPGLWGSFWSRTGPHFDLTSSSSKWSPPQPARVELHYVRVRDRWVLKNRGASNRTAVLMLVYVRVEKLVQFFGSVQF